MHLYAFKNLFIHFCSIDYYKAKVNNSPQQTFLFLSSENQYLCQCIFSDYPPIPLNNNDLIIGHSCLNPLYVSDKKDLKNYFCGFSLIKV